MYVVYCVLWRGREATRNFHYLALVKFIVLSGSHSLVQVLYLAAVYIVAPLLFLLLFLHFPFGSAVKPVWLYLFELIEGPMTEVSCK